MAIQNPCNCEHAAHFPNDEWPHQPEIAEAIKGVPMLHEYLMVEAGEQKAQYVGAICNECATHHMKDWLI